MDHSSTPAPHAARYRTPQELTDFVPTLDAAPTDRGLLKLIVRRPALGEREVLAVGRLDPAYGLEGDSWLSRGSTRSADGRAHPDMQARTPCASSTGAWGGPGDSGGSMLGSCWRARSTPATWSPFDVQADTAGGGCQPIDRAARGTVGS